MPSYFNPLRRFKNVGKRLKDWTVNVLTHIAEQIESTTTLSVEEFKEAIKTRHGGHACLKWMEKTRDDFNCCAQLAEIEDVLQFMHLSAILTSLSGMSSAAFEAMYFKHTISQQPVGVIKKIAVLLKNPRNHAALLKGTISYRAIALKAAETFPRSALYQQLQGLGGWPITARPFFQSLKESREAMQDAMMLEILTRIAQMDNAKCRLQAWHAKTKQST